MPDQAAAERIARQTEALWQEFKAQRETYQDLVYRMLTPVIDERFTYARGGADYRTPALLKALGDVGDILTIRPTVFDGIPSAETKRARDESDYIRMFCAALWDQVDRDRWFDRVVGNGQCIEGLKVTRKYHRPLKTPPDGDEKARDEWMRANSNIFGIDDVETLAVRFYPVAKAPKQIIYEYEMPMIDAYADYEVDGSYVGEAKGKKYRPLADANSTSGLKFVGDDYRIDDTPPTDAQMVKVLVYEYEDKTRTCPVCADEHLMWTSIEIIRASGKALKDGVIVEKTALPWRGPSFMVTRGRFTNHRDPDKRFVPFFYPALIEAGNINWAESLFMNITSRDTADTAKYIDVSNAPDNFQWPENLAENGFVIDKPDADAGKILMIPGEIREWPNQLAASLLSYMQDSRQRMIESLPNRYVTGDLSIQEADQPATSHLANLQQARQPFDFLLSQSDGTILNDFFNDGVLHAIRYWEYLNTSGVERRFYVSLNQNLNDTLRKGGAEDGQEVYLCASRLSTNPQLTLKTTSETLAEQAERRRQAVEGYKLGVMTSRQLIEAYDYPDVEQQMTLLDEEEVRKQAHAIRYAAQGQAIALFMAAMSDVDPAWLSQFASGSLPQQGPGPQLQPGGTVNLNPARVPTVQLPALGTTGGGPTPTGV